GDDALALFDQGDEQVLGLELGIIRFARQLDRRGDRLACFFGVLVDVHNAVPWGRHAGRPLHVSGRVGADPCVRSLPVARRGGPVCPPSTPPNASRLSPASAAPRNASSVPASARAAAARRRSHRDRRTPLSCPTPACRAPSAGTPARSASSAESSAAATCRRA